MNPALRFLHLVWALLIACAASLAPLGDARAATTDDMVAAVKLICGNVPEVCGPYDDVVLVADACLKGSDELACALSVMNVSGNKGPQQALDRYQLVMECINGASYEVPVTAECDKKLAEAGMPEPQRSEAKALVKMCVQAQDVDDVIVCADALLDSSFADDAGVNPPSWVDSLFDIYMDIRTPDYVSLIYHVGASVACLVANILGGIDVCGLLETLVAIGGAIADGFEAVGEFFSDIFGGGGCNYEWNGQCVHLHQLLAKLLEIGLAVSVEARKAGDAQWAARRGQAFADIKKHEVFLLTVYPATPADEEAAWTIHTAQVYPQWDEAMKGVVDARKAKIEAALQAVKPLDLVKALQDAPGSTAVGTFTGTRAQCMAASKAETDKIFSWTQAGRAPKGKGVVKHDATCGYRVAQAVLGGLNACTLQLNETNESLRAKCDTAPAMDACKVSQHAFGHERVEGCDFGKGGEKGVAHAALKAWAPMPLVARCTYEEGSFSNAFKCNDPAAAKECMAKIGLRYGYLDWPKAGIAECKVVETPKRLKAVADAAKVAQAIPGIVMPGSKMNNLGCKPDGIDAAVVSCVQLVLDATQVAKVKDTAGVPVRQCTTAESTTKPTHAWLEEACIAQEPWKNVQVTKDLAKPGSTGPAAMDKLGAGTGVGAGLKGPGTPGGPGSGAGLVGKAGPGMANPAQPGAKTGPGVVNPATPRIQPGAIDKKLNAPSSLKQPGT